LLVTSRETAAAYVQKAADAKRIGRELAVRYIIDGSVEQAGGQIRVMARLADAESGTYLWAYRYDRPAGDPLDVEDEIVGQAVNGVRRALTFSEADRHRESTETEQLIWRGRALTWADNREKQTDAARIFDRALENAPSSLPAKFGLAGALAISGHGIFNVNDREKVRRAADIVDAALPAVPRDAGAHFTRGQVLRIQGRFDEAIREFEMAIDLDHNFAGAYAMLGACKLMTGALAEVRPLEERAIRLDPLNPAIANSYQRIGMTDLLQSRVDQAIPWFEKARAAHAMWQGEWVYQTYAALAAAYALSGEPDRAADALAEARKTSEFPASTEQYCSHAPVCATPAMRALAEPTYLKGLRLAGLADE
jgi:tetratricopeptide (TPR) repeat protein